jgi:diaminopimelate epimerase
MELLKSHGLGNDYLVLLGGALPVAHGIRALCHRHTGPGADGVLIRVPSELADYGLRIFNPDGGEAEKSGNGLRIFARYLVDHCGAADDFTVETKGGIVRCRVRPESVSVDMGRATFVASEIPVDLEGECVQRTLRAAGEEFTFTAVGIGNPHCVIFRPEPLLDGLRWRRWAPVIERHPVFPNRVNVQFVRHLGGQRLEMRVWERGAGETSASGSSSCAAAAAAVRNGLCEPGLIQLLMPGGPLQVEVKPDYELVLTGPVEEIGRIVLSQAWCKAHRLTD